MSLRKYGFALLALSLLLIASGCGSNSGIKLEENKLNVITTFYPLYDFSTKIGGERANVINLVPAGVDSHDWAPKPQDVKQISSADVFIYNGGGFEGWVDEFLEGLDADAKLVVVEGIHEVDLISANEEAEAEGEHGHEEETGHSHSHGDIDPHAWLSPQQSIPIAESILEGFVQADPENEAVYTANFESLKQKLLDLDAAYKQALEAAPRKEIVVSHEAYAYLARDYGLEQVGVMGLTPEAEPTAQDMKRIAEFVKEHDVKYILFEELASPKLAKTLADDLGIETLVFNPVEGLTEQQADDGEDYFSIMAKNLESLSRALQ